MEFKVEQIAAMVGGKIEGDGEKKVNRIEKIQDAKEGSISFLSNPKYENFIYTTNASAVLVNKSFEPKKKLNCTLIRVDDAYNSFTALLEEYSKIMSYQKSGIEEPAYIGSGSSTGNNIYRGAYSYIGENTIIGNNVKIYPHTYIGDNVKINDDSIIYAGVKIYNNTIIGKNCTIHAGAVVGSHGFGFAPQADGTYKSIPQVGNVIVKDNVDIGANTVIDCATFDSTVINQGVKLDNLIQVAHNVEIGENTVMAAQSGISGSSKIGKNCIIAGQVGIAGHLNIGNQVTLAAKAGILSDVKDKEVRLGSPSMDRMKFLKSFSVFRILPELKSKIQQLEEKIINLSASNKNNEH